MGNRVLVVYASRAGSTAEVAKFVGQRLREGGLDVDVRALGEVPDVKGYDALVMGSAIWAGKPLPDAVRFAAQHKDMLAELPVAFFALCELLRDPTPEHRQQSLRFLDPLTAIVSPISVEVFAGARNLQNVNPLLRWLLMHVLKIREGDWRDWDQISAWSATLQSLLATQHRSRRHVA